MPSRKMPRGLVALSSSAIATIYFAGFVATRSADAGLAAAAAASATSPGVETSASPAATNPAAASTPLIGASAPAARTTTAPASQATTATTAPTTAPTAASSSSSSTTTTTTTSNTSSTSNAAYKDGTYTGQGTSRRGGVSVAVTIQSGRIQNVTITASDTEYPVSRIASLPAQVVSRQSAQINTITGATYSSQAFQQAVQQALTRAV